MQNTIQPFPPAKRLLRLGLVGGGQGALIGQVHAAGARLSNRWQIVAGALSATPEKAKASGQDWLLPADRCYTDYRDMAQREAARKDGIDAVAIVTPNHVHAPVALAFMQQGIHVICDKPLTKTLSEVGALVDAQRASGVFFAVTYAYASHAMVRQARAMVKAGVLGDLRQVHVEYFQDWAINVTDQINSNAPLAWRLDKTKTGESLTIADIGTHAEHLVRFVTGLDIDSVRAELYTTGAPKELEDTAFVHIRMRGGVPGTLMVSQAMAGAQCGLRLRLAGTFASMEWQQEQPEVVKIRPVGKPEYHITRGYGAGIAPEVERLVRMPRGHPEALSDAWANLYLELAVAIAAHNADEVLPNGLVAYPTLQDGKRGMEFVDAVLRSYHSQGWCRVGV